MKKLVFMLAVMLTLGNVSNLTLNAQKLFVGTYNIRNNNNDDAKKGNGWDNRVGVICGQVNFEDPDIFGTQEVLHNQVLDLKAQLNGYDYIGVGRDDGKEAGEYECIWYKTDRIELLDKGNFWLSETPDKPGLGWDAACIRICSWGKFRQKATGFEFYYFNLHMDHVGVVARREAAKLTVKKIPSIAGTAPVILTGDFNVDQNNEIYSIFTDSGILKDSFTAAKQRFAENGTFNSFNPNLKTDSRIDHIFVSPIFSVDNYAIMTNGYWTEVADEEISKGVDAPREINFKRHRLRTASDHYPVWAKISISK
jgi:endonuclease/exonuclease/phosphatase family metal-dependent hydrolase